MKKQFTIFLFVVMAIATNAQTKLYEFTFDNSLSASVGSGSFNATGTAFTTDRYGNADSALVLNGVSTSATLSNLPTGNAARTISVWFSVIDTPAGPSNLLRYGTFTGAGVFGTFADQNGYFYFQSGAGDLRLTHNLQTNQWVHLVLTLANDTTYSIYVNGSLDASSNRSFNTLASAFQLGEVNLQVAFDDLNIYSGAMDSAQVRQLYDASAPTPTPTSINRNATVSAEPIEIYPNPTNGQINLSVPSRVQVYNSTGQMLGAFQQVNNLDLSGQPSGLYILMFQDERGALIQTTKLLKN